MALPEVTEYIVDGGLGTVPANASKTCVTMGVCSGGVPGELYAFSDITTLRNTLGLGPLVEAVAAKLAIAGGPQYACPVNPSQAGSFGSTTHNGGGAATVAKSAVPLKTIVATCVVAGDPDTAQIKFQLGTDAPFTLVLAAAWTTDGFLIPGTETVWTFTDDTYTTSDVYTQATNSTTVAHTAGAGPAVPTAASSPLDDFDVLLTVTTTGAPATGAFKYSLDGGKTNVGPIAIVSGGKYVIPSTGMMVTWASSATEGDTYEFSAVTAGFTTQDVTDAFTALLGDSTQWSLVHIVGEPASSSAAASLASAVDTQMQLAESSQFRYAHAFIEAPKGESNATIKAAFASFASDTGRVGVHIGDAMVRSPISGRATQRSGAWVHVARLCAVAAGVDAADVSLGPLPLVQSLVFDSFTDGGDLDAARFSTLRTLIGKAGYFVANSKSMATDGSDYSYTVRGRVMDEACTAARAALLPYLNGGVRVDKTTGFIDERDAAKIEKTVNALLKAVIVDTGDASDVGIQISRTENMLSTENMPVTVWVVPKAYARKISATIGFKNPALLAS